MKTDLILASKSQSRRMLLNNAGLIFKTMDSQVDENEIKTRSPWIPKNADALALELAREKAKKISFAYPQSFVIGCDQTLATPKRLYDKPNNLENTRNQLNELRGTEHFLYSAISLFKEGQEIWHFVDKAHLKMRLFSEEFLESYLKKCQKTVCQSVGGYQLEGYGVQLFEKIDGDFFTILGLPLLPLLSFLRKEGILPQ